MKTVDDGSGNVTKKDDADAGGRKAMWSQLKDLVGADIMSKFSIPIFLMEPISVLQKTAENMQYCELLDRACEEEEEFMRLAYVAALAVSVYSSNERTKKPFNPILGETWEMVLPEVDGIYVAEQVCHHPPIGASHCETPRWTFDLTSAVRTKFMGNWVDVWPKGRTRIHLKECGDVYNLLPPASRVNNLVVGRLWIDTFGEMRVNNLKTGASAVLTFKECNMFGAGRWEVSGDVLGADGECKLKLKGKWNESMTATQPDGSSGRILWAKNPDPKEGALVEKYGFDNWTLRMNAAKDAPKGLLKSDSRLRPDRMALEKGDDTTAQKMKHVLEEKQRAERRKREANGGEWKPRWFKLAAEADLHELELDVGTAVWEWNGAYNEELAKRTEKGIDNVLETEFDPWEFEDTKDMVIP